MQKMQNKLICSMSYDVIFDRDLNPMILESHSTMAGDYFALKNISNKLNELVEKRGFKYRDLKVLQYDLCKEWITFIRFQIDEKLQKIIFCIPRGLLITKVLSEELGKSITKKFANGGIECKLATYEDLERVNGGLGLKNFFPQAIIQSGLNYLKAKGTNQIFVNHPIVDGNTFDKYKLNKILSEEGIKVPETSLATNESECIDLIKQKQEEGKTVVLKPTLLMLGVAQTVVKPEDDVKEVLSNTTKRLGNNWFRDLSPFCVQEFIRNDGFIAEDGNRYHYDFRVSWANGKIIGISARRSGFPLGSNSLKSFKTNLDTGGKMIGVFVGDRKEPLSYIDLTSGLEVDMGSLGLKKILDRKGLVMSYEMIERMEKMLTRASSAIEKESIKEGYIKPAYSELVLERVAKYGKELQ